MGGGRQAGSLRVKGYGVQDFVCSGPRVWGALSRPPRQFVGGGGAAQFVGGGGAAQFVGGGGALSRAPSTFPTFDLHGSQPCHAQP